jgi:CheY-like chemotaxis protein
MKILVVEDENVIRENTLEMLELKGYDVKGASNGNEAIEILNSFSPDIVFCDIMMPQMDGFEFLKWFRNESNYFNIPFVFLSAKAEQEDRDNAISLGANDFLLKPFSFSCLFDVINKYTKKD